MRGVFGAFLAPNLHEKSKSSLWGANPLLPMEKKGDIITLHIYNGKCSLVSKGISTVLLQGLPCGRWRAGCPFFKLTTEANSKQFYNNKPVVLALDKIDLDSGILDEVYSYELIVKGFQWGQLKQDAKTGYNITLGKEYSFKLDFTAKDGVYVYTLWVKAVGEAEYTNLGTYDYPAHGDAGSMFMFSSSSNANGNQLDNFKITTTLAK